jgi:hypothetical protein
MSYAFIAALKKNPQQSYVQLLNSIRDELEGKYDQKPQLSCSHPLDTDLLYVSFTAACGVTSACSLLTIIAENVSRSHDENQNIRKQMPHTMNEARID